MTGEKESLEKLLESLRIMALAGVSLNENQVQSLKNALSRVPSSDEFARKAAEESEAWKSKVFVSVDHKDGKLFMVPKNIESFDQMFILSIINLAIKKGYYLVPSTTEVKECNKLRANAELNSFIAGYCLELISPSSKMPEGKSAFLKGRIACVLEHFKPEDSEHSRFYKKPKKTIGQALSEVEATKELWAIRQGLANFIRNIDYKVEVPKEELLLPLEERKKLLTISKSWEDKMVFRPAESQYYAELASEAVKKHSDLMNSDLKNLSMVIKTDKDVRSQIKAVCERATQLRSHRAGKLFPHGDKKPTVEYRKLSLQVKVDRMSAEEYLAYFSPAKMDIKSSPYVNSLLRSLRDGTSERNFSKKLEEQVKEMITKNISSSDVLNEFFLTYENKFREENPQKEPQKALPKKQKKKAKTPPSSSSSESGDESD